MMKLKGKTGSSLSQRRAKDTMYPDLASVYDIGKADIAFFGFLELHSHFLHLIDEDEILPTIF